jgi:hypothetical protein
MTFNRILRVVYKGDDIYNDCFTIDKSYDVINPTPHDTTTDYAGVILEVADDQGINRLIIVGKNSSTWDISFK